MVILLILDCFNVTMFFYKILNKSKQSKLLYPHAEFAIYSLNSKTKMSTKMGSTFCSNTPYSYNALIQLKQTVMALFAWSVVCSNGFANFAWYATNFLLKKLSRFGVNLFGRLSNIGKFWVVFRIWNLHSRLKIW